MSRRNILGAAVDTAPADPDAAFVLRHRVCVEEPGRVPASVDVLDLRALRDPE